MVRRKYKVKLIGVEQPARRPGLVARWWRLPWRLRLAVVCFLVAGLIWLNFFIRYFGG
jgi:hypothetical protein